MSAMISAGGAAGDPSPQAGPFVTPVIPMDDVPSGPVTSSRSRRVIVVIALAVLGVLAVAGTAVAFWPREDSGIVACRRIEELSKTFAGGGQPTITQDEGRELADQLAGSDHEKLARLGEVFQYGYDSPDTTKAAEGVLGAVMFASAVYSPCMEAGLSMTRPIPPR